MDEVHIINLEGEFTLPNPGLKKSQEDSVVPPVALRFKESALYSFLKSTAGSFSLRTLGIVSAGLPAMTSFSLRNLRKCRIDAILRALVVPVRLMPASRFIKLDDI